MIEQINDINDLTGYGKKDIYSVRILSLAAAYGCKYPFARFYRQLNDNGEVSAVLSALDNDITASFNEKLFDKNELLQFVQMIGFSTFLCDEAFDMEYEYASGAVMQSDKKIEINCEYSVIDEYPHLFDLYNFVDYDENSFEAWYVDISHRIRHNAARAVSLNIKDEMISSAIFSSIYNEDAVLTAVRTSPEFRGCGYASALVSAMCCDVKGTVYLMREANKNESFYKKLGFENCGIWRMYK